MEPEIKIRGYHTDIYQHVNNARYLEFLEEGRWQLFDDHVDMQIFTEKGLAFFVVNINISYKSQTKVNDVIIIKSGLLKTGNKSGILKQQVINKHTGEICVDADVTFVIVNSERKSIQISGEVKDILSKIPEFKGI